MELPPPFPSVGYDEFRKLVQTSLKEPHRFQFISAMNAVGFRYKAMSDAQIRAIGSIVVDGTKTSGEQQYIQDSGIANFFFNACSCLDALAYAVFACGALLNPGDFPLETPRQQRDVNRRMLVKRFQTALGNRPLTNTLQEALLGEKTASLWGLRNVLLHRQHPPRFVYYPDDGVARAWLLTDVELAGHLPADKADLQMAQHELGIDYLQRQRAWVDKCVLDVIRHTHEFCAEILPAATFHLAWYDEPEMFVPHR